MAGSKKSEGGLVWGVRASLWRGMWGVEEGVPGRISNGMRSVQAVITNAVKLAGGSVGWMRVGEMP